MKQTLIIKTSLFIISLLFFTESQAQKKEAYEMMVNGVKVIVQPTDNDIVEIRTVIKGGVQNYAADKAGIENLAMQALTECGTANDDKNSFKNKLDKVSAQVNGVSNMDFASFNMNCIKMDLKTVWPLYVDAFTAPRFDEKEFDRIKQDQINILKAQSSQPDYAIEKLAKETAFAGKDYSKDPMGTEKTVKVLTASETKGYFNSIADKSHVFIVVVGNLERSEIESMVSGFIAKLPDGKPYEIRRENYTAKVHSFKAEKKDMATNYVQAITGGPPPGTKEYNAFLLAMRIMYDRHFLEVRTNNGLSYAPFTFFDGGLTGYSSIGASTTDPNKYIQVVNKLIDRTKLKGFTDEEVRNMKTRYITSTYYRQETNSETAASFTSNEVLHNNWKRAITLNEDLKPVTAKDVSDAFKKYITNLTWVYQGNPSLVNPGLYTHITVKEKLPPSTFTEKKVNK
jgi:predicted Zn-dependent peptidase